MRKEVKYEYLQKKLTVVEIYRMYTEWCAKKGYQLEGYTFYCHVFKERFHLKFQQPKKDKCDTCESYNNLDKSQVNEEIQLFPSRVETI